MDLEDTRAIPMWLAHPALPVGVGLVLLLALAGVEVVARSREEEPPAAPRQPVDRLGPERVAGKLRTGPPPVPAGKAIKEAKGQAATLARAGDYLGAARVYSALPEEVRSSPAFRGELEAQVRVFLSKGGERLLFDVDKGKLDPTAAVEKLEAFLAFEGAAELPVAERIRAKLAELE